MSLPTPNTRKEQYLNAIATGNTVDMPAKPITREEAYLDAIAKNGGGSGGAENYAQLSGKPQINNVELESGNNSLSALGIQGKLTFDNAPTDGSNNPVKSGGIYASEKDIYAVMGEMGAKNLNSYPYNETTHTDNGVDWTDNKDGTVTANNAATGNSTFLCHARQSASANRLIVPNGSYILTGCPTGGSDSTYRISANITKNGSVVGLGTDYGNGVIITVNGDDNYQDKAIIQIGCDVRNGYTANNLTFKPMLRLASDTDDTYQQYAKTNKQLTDEIANKVDKVAGKGLSTNDYSDTEKGKVADNTSAIEATQDMISDAYDSIHTYAVGDYCIYENALYKCNTASTTGTWDSSKWDAVTVAEELGDLTDKVDRGSVSVTGDGVKTWYQLLYELTQGYDYSKITNNSVIVVKYNGDDNGYVFHLSIRDAIVSYVGIGLTSKAGGGVTITLDRIILNNLTFLSVVADDTLTNKTNEIGGSLTLYY